MQELEKILEDIRGLEKILITDPIKLMVDMGEVEDIIRKHMNDGWIPVDRELPPNAKHEGAFCPKYQVMTKYGVTEGWYNPFLESWYVLLWFMTKRYLNSEIDLERGDCPNVVEVRNEVNEKYNIVLAWRPLPKLYSLERSDNNDGE